METTTPLMRLNELVRPSFRWWRDEGDIPYNHISRLEQVAYDRIRNLVGQANSGELIAEIEGVEYSGWFDIAGIKE